MSIVLQGSTSGSITLQEPAVAGSTVLDLPATSGTVLVGGTQNIPKTALPTGSVLQVVSTTKTDVFSSSSTSYTDVTGLSVSITPTSASSKILVFANVFVSCSSANYLGLVQIVRDSTAIGNNTSGSSAAYANSGSAGSASDIQREFQSAGLTILDSPATTSAVTYKMQLRTDSGTAYVNRVALSTDWIGSSSITVMEIAA